MMGIFDYMLANQGMVFGLVFQHMFLVLVAELIAVAVGLPLGVIITRKRYGIFGRYVSAFANIGQSVPSLSVLGLAIPILGIGFMPSVIALFLYVVLPIIRNTQAGISSVDVKIKEAATGIGLDQSQILKHIEIPLSSKVIIAGIRTSTVFCIGTATLVFLIGGGGLGELIFTGIAMVDPQRIVAGVVPAALLAVGAELGLGLAERRVATF